MPDQQESRDTSKKYTRRTVVLVEGVLDRDDVVLRDEVVVVLGELLAGEPLGRVRVRVLEAIADAMLAMSVTGCEWRVVAD